MKKLLTAAAVALGMSLPMSAQTSYKPVELDALQVEEVFSFLTSEHFESVSSWRIFNNKLYAYHNFMGIHEVRRAIDMMWKYGTTRYTADQYKLLAGRNINVQMNEWAASFNQIRWGYKANNPANAHAVSGFFGVAGYAGHSLSLSYKQYHAAYPTAIRDEFDYAKLIFSNSYSSYFSKEGYGKFGESYERKMFEYLYKMPNSIFFQAIGNYSTEKIAVHPLSDKPDVPDEFICFNTFHFGNREGETDKHAYITVGTGIDFKYRLNDLKLYYEGSQMPYGFNPDFVCAMAQIPYYSEYNGIYLIESSDCSTSSYPNQDTAGMLLMCSRLWPEAEDVNDVMDDLRTLNTRALLESLVEGIPSVNAVVINPGKYFQHRSMPKELPTSVDAQDIVELKKGDYPGIMFSGPGVEVKAGGEWIEVKEENLSRIKALPAMELEFRFNAALASRYGNEATIEVSAIDDQYKAFSSLVKQHTISLNSTGIEDVITDESLPEVKKVIMNGKVVIMKNGKLYTPSGVMIKELK
ncbi:MAG: hypothetical protein MJZ12_03790 [Prevotella sp.]|nr:hypothetical protein [Prevotella sp.]